jgi:hypothetical protein
MLDPDELENLNFPVDVLLIEKLNGDVSDASLYEAGYNMFHATLNSLKDIPEGYEIYSLIDWDEEE